MRRRLLLALALGAFFALWSAAQARADGPESIGAPVDVDVLLPAFCEVDHRGIVTEPGRYCSRRAIERSIPAVKMEAALAYQSFLQGRLGANRLREKEALLGWLTGEAIPVVALGGEGSARGYRVDAGVRLRESFMPVFQANSYYCGPATALSILRFLGPTTSRTYNPDHQEHDAFNGDPERDQRLLAGRLWLGTEASHGTDWGQSFMPATLNDWRGTSWYIGSATPMLEGGTLTQDQAWAAIVYDTDRSYPVAENVVYGPGTYYPAGFLPGVTYRHWDLVVGQYTDQAGRKFVRVGQTYASPGEAWQPLQEVPWEQHWPAIGQRYGLVW